MRIAAHSYVARNWHSLFARRSRLLATKFAVFAILMLGGVLLVALAIVLSCVTGMLHPLFGWTDHPGWAARYERLGRPWWLPRPSWHAEVKHMAQREAAGAERTGR